MSSRKRRSAKRATRVFIVDDHPILRSGLAAKISDEPDLEVCGEADNEDDALKAIQHTCPDVAIVDIALRSGHGIDLIRKIKARFPGVKMLVLSAYKESLYAERALRAGAMGYLNKQESGDKIFTAIRTVLSGDRYLSPEMTQRLVGLAVGGGEPPRTSPVESLSDRELHVFRLIGEGLTTSAIARQLHLSPHTIESHREKIKHKLNLKTSNELLHDAIRWLLENS